MFKGKKRNTISKIVEENLDYLFRFAFYRIGNREEAEDIVYEAILKLLEKNTKEIKLESVRSYLFRIVLNLCIDKQRNQKNEIVWIEELDIEDDAIDIAEKLEFERVDTYLKNIEPQEADVIRMKIMGDITFVEISNILSIPQSTAKSRFKSGMEKLRKLFTDK
ncbi:MAG: RNA polymerase sigma factor, partial [Muribaculaceae bacterium]|nr:RNA polymerase sigma factor [Muribaculaceae bacterium]